MSEATSSAPGSVAIVFGFTIYQFLNKLRDAGVLPARPAPGPRSMKAEGLVHAESGFPASLVLIGAVIVALGLGAAVSMLAHAGPHD